MSASHAHGWEARKNALYQLLERLHAITAHARDAAEANAHAHRLAVAAAAEDVRDAVIHASDAALEARRITFQRMAAEEILAEMQRPAWQSFADDVGKAKAALELGRQVVELVKAIEDAAAGASAHATRTAANRPSKTGGAP